MAIEHLNYKQIDISLRQRRAQVAALQLRNLVGNPGITDEQRARAQAQLELIQKWVEGTVGEE